MSDFPRCRTSVRYLNFHPLPASSAALKSRRPRSCRREPIDLEKKRDEASDVVAQSSDPIVGRLQLCRAPAPSDVKRERGFLPVVLHGALREPHHFVFTRSTRPECCDDPLSPSSSPRGRSARRSVRRPRPLDRCRRMPLRQRRRPGPLGPHASCATQPKVLEDPNRAGHRDPRPPRDLPQQPTPPLGSPLPARARHLLR